MSVNKLVLVECGNSRFWLDPTKFVYSEIYKVTQKSTLNNKVYWELNIYFEGASGPLSIVSIQSKKRAIELEEIFMNEVKKCYHEVNDGS